MSDIDLVKKDYLQQIAEELSKIDTKNAEKWTYDENPSVKVVDQQKIYFWIRLYLKEENFNVEIGDEIIISYKPLPIFLNNRSVNPELLDLNSEAEELSTKFIAYGKKGLEKDYQNVVVNYSQEDDKKVLCLMVDENIVNFSEEIPFIRTLFKTGRHYEFQLIRRDELLFINKKNGVVLDYYDCDF